MLVLWEKQRKLNFQPRPRPGKRKKIKEMKKNIATKTNLTLETTIFKAISEWIVEKSWKKYKNF